MALLKNLLGNNSRDRELAEEVRTVLQDMRKECARYEALVQDGSTASEQLEQLHQPIAKAGGEIDELATRLGDLEQRFAAMTQLSAHLQTLDERAEGIAQSQRRAETQIAGSVEDAQRIRTLFEELSQKVDLAVDLKDRLTSFMEIEKPFQQLRDDAEGLRGQVEGAGEHLGRLREQSERLMDAHKLAMSKMEALDRRRDDLGRELQDKERRVAGVEQAVRGMDGVQLTVSDVKREIGTLKALGDSVVQKAAALEAQRDSVERALAQAEELDRSMRQIDAGLRQQQEHEKSLGALQDQVAALRSLHESVLERSNEISHLQHEAEEQTRTTRQDLASMTDEMRKTVERFDFESRGLESVHERVADLRGALSDFENRFKGLSESSQAAAELKSQTQTVATHLQALSEEVGHLDKEIVQLRAMRRNLDEIGGTVRDVGHKVTRIEASQPAIEAALRDIESLNGTHATVRDTLERAQLAHDEMIRMREGQSDTRSWLHGVEQMVAELKDQVTDLNQMAPTVELVLKQAQRIGESAADFESGREFMEELHRRMTDLGTLGSSLDERGRKLKARMEAAEQRFAGLETQSEEAERLSQTIGGVSSGVREAGRKADEIKKTVAAIETRCTSVESLAGETATLRKDIEQRQQALAEATKDFQRVSELRQKAAAAAQQLGALTEKLTGALSTADQQVTRVDDLSTELEDRVASLQPAERRLIQFEERLAKWDLVEQDIARSLEQIAARQSTVEALQDDLDRMSAMAEKTASDVREITSSQQQIEQSRKLLIDVTGRMQSVRDTASTLDERKRQMTKAEERLSRAEALLVDVRSSLEALEGQKAIVDQAVEKAGSLQFLLKQAEATIEGLREEREMAARVRTAVAIVREGDEEEGEAKVA